MLSDIFNAIATISHWCKLNNQIEKRRGRSHISTCFCAMHRIERRSLVHRSSSFVVIIVIELHIGVVQALCLLFSFLHIRSSLVVWLLRFFVLWPLPRLYTRVLCCVVQHMPAAITHRTKERAANEHANKMKSKKGDEPMPEWNVLERERCVALFL